jgi:hypothetical protein
MSKVLKIIMIAVGWIVSGSLTARESPKAYEIGKEPLRINVSEFQYLIQPISTPFKADEFARIDSWQHAKAGLNLLSQEIHNKRVVISFDIKTAVETVYFIYSWASPLDSQKFVLLSENGEVIDTVDVRKNMLLSRVDLSKGSYKVLFIAESARLSDIKFNFYIMNAAFVGGTYLDETKFFLYVYGVGSAFIFFNFTMYLLHRKPYFIYYVGYSLTILFLLMVGSGDIPQGSSIFWNLSLSLNCLFTILMSTSVLRMREFHPWLVRVSIFLWIISTALISSRYMLDTRLFWVAGMVCGLVCYFLCMYAAVRRMFSGYIPATFFALGWGVLAIGYGLNIVAIYVSYIPSLIYAAYVAYAIESMLFAVALAYRTRDSEQRAVQDKVHALSQLQKVVYSHQMEQIKKGQELESTMPTKSGHACVISFDIIGSSKIKHIRAKTFFRNVFTRCNAIMTEGYDGKNLKANAYRIKEMGDGFLCSLGYPFESMTDNPANEAVDLARRFAEVLSEEAAILHADTPVACGIGIALDALTGFYPEAGTKEYDLTGPALILATRYEAMRKTLFEAEKSRNVLIIQDVVFQSLDPSHRVGFKALDLKEAGVVVRDDPAATKLYYKFLDVTIQAAA